MEPPGRTLRALLLADTHLGLGWTTRRRDTSRRLGEARLAAFEAALAPAHRGEVDLVVHGGDLLHRSAPPAWVVDLALDRLAAVASRGVPVLVVPGNHERGRIPFPLLARAAGLLVFDRPRTYRFEAAGHRVAASGFPFVRGLASADLEGLVAACEPDGARADLRLLCMHQTVEGARVGAQDHTFRPGPDVITGRDLPRGFAAVLSGHIHRGQVLRRDLAGRPLPCPVVYPGATARTSFAERFETKSYALVDLAPTPAGEGALVRARAVPLSRPVHRLEGGAELSPQAPCDRRP